LQRVRRALQCVAVLRGVAGCCRVLQCVAACCSVLQSLSRLDPSPALAIQGARCV